MGCFTQICTSCNKSFELTEENKIKRDYTSVEEISDGKHFVTCTFCGVKNVENYEASTWKPHDIDAAVEIAKCLQEARNNKYIIGDVEMKVGEIKKCKKCGNVTDVVTYNGCMSYQKNFSTMCVCEEKYNFDEDWFEHCGEKDCKLHDGLNVEKMRKEQSDFKRRRDIVKQIMEKAPPKNDGILELDRIAFIFGEMYGDCSINDSRSWVFDDVMLYCARNGLLTTNA